jgi:hypothetical protein
MLILSAMDYTKMILSKKLNVTGYYSHHVIDTFEKMAHIENVNHFYTY